MRNRTAAAVTFDAAPEPEPGAAPGDDVFGKVALPGHGTPSVLAEDLELFDATPPGPPPASGTVGPRARHRAGRPRYVRRTARRKRAVPAPKREWRSGMSMPLLITGALAAGFGLSVGLTSGMERDPADQLTVTMPDLPPHRDPTDAEPSSPTRATTSTPPAATPSTARPATVTAAPPVTVAPTATVRPKRSAAPGATSRPSVPPTRTADPRPDTTASPSRTPPPEEPDRQLLKRGSTGPEVEELQHRLRRLHLYRGSTDGVFGPRLEAALSLFQSLYGIPEERGVYGPKTRAALQSETSRRGRGHDRGGLAGLG
ncbi:peptidoglycan-binding protein [Streptomyces sp. NPDC127584]|uniref:peptidoglycan-binding domain-containing protein n=1 Tax=Streptomyces sp. NPDC127584 TaxID=3345403 RepID=UPI003639108F